MRLSARTGAGRPPSGSYVVDGATLRHPDGAGTAVIATSELDLETLDAARRAAAVESFAALCRTLEAPLQLLVRVRAVPVTAAHAGGPASEQREAAMRLHWRQRLERRPAHERRVYVAVRAAHDHLLDEHAAQVQDALRALGVSAVRLEDGALSAVVADGLRAGLPVPWKEYPGHLDIGSQLVRGFTLQRLPGHAVAAGWLAPVIGVAVDCDIAVHFAPASLGDALSSIGRSLRNFSAHRLLESERGVVGDAHVEVALDSAYMLRERLARNLGRALRLSITVCVRAPDLAALQRGAGTVRAAFAAALARVEPAHFRHLAAFTSTLPLALDALGVAKLVDSGAAATCFPWLDSSGADPDGYRLGASRRSGAPLRLDPFDTTRHGNANVAVLAASGHGKTYAVGALVLEAADHGVASVIIDPEGEYRRVVRAIGGDWVDLAPGTGTAVNVLDCALTDPERATTGVVELAAVLCGGVLSELERAHVDTAAREVCAAAATRGAPPLLEECLPALELRSPAVAAVLRRFCSGALGRMFNRHTTVRIEERSCGISLRDLPDEHIAGATLVLARWLWGLVMRGGRRRHIVFDEVGALCALPPMRALLVQLARRCRKHGASLVVATQNAQDLLSTDEGRVVVTNCASVLLGGHAPAETAVMQAAFGLTERQRRSLETAARGEFLLVAGDRRAELRIEVPALHRSLLEAGRVGSASRAPLDGRGGEPQDVGAPGRADPKMWEN